MSPRPGVNVTVEGSRHFGGVLQSVFSKGSLHSQRSEGGGGEVLTPPNSLVTPPAPVSSST